jgi:hypothetical protein
LLAATAILEIKQESKQASKPPREGERASERRRRRRRQQRRRRRRSEHNGETKANKRQTGCCSPRSLSLGTQSRRLERSCSQSMWNHW